MTKYILGIVAVLLIIGGAWWYLQLSKKPIAASPNAPIAAVPGDKPWVEVLTTAATAVDTSGATTTLQTGDEVALGTIIKTDGAGVILVHFADGSFAKLDPSSSLTITTASYDSASGVSNVRIALSAGTLWSKVLDLVGANSSWQVETSNAVATVRGTSFMTSVSKGKTKVVGIEHKVAVAPLDTKTHQPLTTEADVTTDAQVVIDDTHLAALATRKEKLATTTVSADIPKSDSYKAFKERERLFDTTRDTLRANLGDTPEFRKEFREAQMKDFKEKILKAERSDAPAPADTTTPKDSTVSVPPASTAPAATNTVAPAAQTSGGSSASAPYPVSLSIISNTALSSGITDGDMTIFHATLLLSDNTKKDVTDSVTWNVINKIGVFTRPGTLKAQLPADYAELGEVSGAVYATFKKADGKELNAASAAFTVHAYVPPQDITQG